jgi:cytochrome c oxidase assembly factor CtaG
VGDHHNPAHGGGHSGTPGVGDLGWDQILGWDPGAGVLLPVVALALTYVAGVVVSRRRRVRWSPVRVVSWLAGLASVVLLTSGGGGTLGAQLLSLHMAQHMVPSMLTPILLLAAAGPGSDLSEEPALGCESVTLESVVVPRCPPGPSLHARWRR